MTSLHQIIPNYIYFCYFFFFDKQILTSVEAAGNRHTNDLNREESAHSCQNLATLVEDSVDTDDMNDRTGRHQDGRANWLKQEEVGALLIIEINGE